MIKLKNIKLEESKDFNVFRNAIRDTNFLEEENSENIKALLKLNKDTKYIINNYNNLPHHIDKSVYGNIDNTYILIQFAIVKYLEKFYLEMMIDDIEACLSSGAIDSKDKAKYTNMIVIKQEDSIVDLAIGEDEIPSISGGVLANLYMKNIRWKFFNDRTNFLMVKKIENWSLKEPMEVLVFLNNIGESEQDVFLSSCTLVDLVWKEGPRLFERNIRYDKLMIQSYLKDTERMNSYEVSACLRAKIYLFNLLENKFLEDGDFQYISKELENAPLWINNKEFQQDLENAKVWDDLSFSKEDKVVINPTLSFYYLMKKHQPKLIELLSHRLAQEKSNQERAEQYFATILNDEIKKVASLEKWSFWPTDMKYIFNDVINSEMKVVVDDTFSVKEKKLSDFIIENFENNIKSTLLSYKRNILDYADEDSTKISSNFYCSNFHNLNNDFIHLVPIVLETEKNENKRSILNFIKFINDCYLSNPTGSICDSYEKHSYLLANCKQEHYAVLLDGVKKFLDNSTKSVTGIESAFFYSECYYREARVQIEGMEILLEKSIMSHMIPVNSVKQKLMKF